MKLLKFIIILLSIILAFLLTITAILPSYLKVQKEIVIYAPQNYTYKIIKDLKSWTKWFTTLKIDRNINIYFSSNNQNKLIWNSSNPNVGNGRIVLTKKIPENLIIADLNLQNDKSGKLTFKIVPKSNYCLLKLEFSTKMTFFEKWMGFFLSTIIGPTLEKSLEDIKSISEYQYNKEKNETK